MSLANMLIQKALFPGKSSGVMAAIWNGEANLTDNELTQFSEYTPTMDELSGGLLFIQTNGGYVPFTLDGTGGAKVEVIEEVGMIQIMVNHAEEWKPIFMVVPTEFGGGIWRNPEAVTDYTDYPMIVVW